MATAKTIQKQKALLLDQLRIVPIVEIACKKVGISRATFYRWCAEDDAFRIDADNAKVDGIENINDMSEAQLLSLIREKKYAAIQLWLRNHHHRFMSEDKRDFIRKVQKQEELNAYQKELLSEALSYFK